MSNYISKCWARHISGPTLLRALGHWDLENKPACVTELELEATPVLLESQRSSSINITLLTLEPEIEELVCRPPFLADTL